MKGKKKKIPANEAIKAKEVRVVDEKEHFGVLPVEEALRLAKERNLDLVQITDNVEPPVCKIIDYGKFAYREKKKKSPEKKTSKPEVKTMRLGFSISPHDMETKANSVEKFLKEGDSVRIVLPLKGRQKALEEVGREKLQSFLDILGNKIEFKTEKEISKEPRGLTITITKS